MRAAIHAEWTKLRTSPGTIWLLLAVIVSTVGVSALTTAATTCVACGGDVLKTSLTGVQLGQAIAAIAGVLMMGTEYSNGLARLTLTAIPRRTRVLSAKALVLTAVLLVTSAAAVLGAFLAGRAILADNGFARLSISDGTVMRALVGSTLYLTLIGLLGLGIATAVRSSAGAIGAVLALLFVLPVVSLAVSDPDWQRKLEQIGPTSAGLAIQASTNLSELPIKPWHGLGVLALWAVAGLVSGGLLLARRDA